MRPFAVSCFAPHSILRWATRAAVVLLVATLCFAPTIGSQITPLEDIVPIEQLEIRTDDLIRLATSMSEGVRDLKTAELSVRTLQTLAPSAAVTNLEMQIAQVNFQTTQQRVNVLRAIAEAQLETAQTKLEFLRRIAGGLNNEEEITGAQVNPRIRQAEAQVRILQMILDIR